MQIFCCTLINKMCEQIDVCVAHGDSCHQQPPQL